MIGVLTAQTERLRAELRGSLLALDSALTQAGASSGDRKLLSDAIRGLNELFLLVVVGEFNAGKSALLNELIGATILKEGVTPTTEVVTLVRYGEREAEEWQSEGFIERRLPSTALQNLAVVDTPGTNAIVRGHEELTRDFIPRADLVLFVTSADRPLTESERALMERIREWDKKIVFVINKTDLLETPNSLQSVIDFVRKGLQETLSLDPPLFSVSVKLARASIEARDPAIARALLGASRMDELRSYVFRTLDEEERLRLKLATPLGVAENLLQKYGKVNDERLTAIEADRELVENVERQVDVYVEDLRRDAGPRLSEIENVIHELDDRGERFFEENVRLGRVFDLLNPERTRGAFEREVINDTAERIDRVVTSTVDWFVEAEARLWRQVSGMVRQRQQTVSGVGEDPDFISARREVLGSVAERTRTAMQGFDREREAREVGESMRDAVAQTAIAEIGAVSLGAAIALLFGTVAADVTGLLAATLAAGLGLYIIPNKKKRAIADFHAKTNELRERLVGSLRTQLEREIGGSTERVREAIAPYTRYVRAEAGKLIEQRESQEQVRNGLGRLRSELKESVRG